MVRWRHFVSILALIQRDVCELGASSEFVLIQAEGQPVSSSFDLPADFTDRNWSRRQKVAIPMRG
jgi:hypothetical protein